MKVNFFWCEDVIDQANNKVMLIGLFPDQHILVLEEYVKAEKLKLPNDQLGLMGIEKLCVLINLSGADKDVNACGQFYSPDGNAHGPIHDFGTIPFIENKSANIIFKASPFPFPTLGIYKLVVNFGDEKFESDCLIDIN